MKACSVTGCGRPHQAKGLCHAHYMRLHETGSVDADVPLKIFRTEHNGLRQHPMYDVWNDMVRRCTNHRRKDYQNYGARGIKVCERWQSFKNFIADMGPRPDGTTLDRIDNDGNYEFDNCRWATQLEQGSNRRTNRRLTFGDETLTVAEWAIRAAIGYDTFLKRLTRHGWSIEKALATPLRQTCG